MFVEDLGTSLRDLGGEPSESNPSVPSSKEGLHEEPSWRQVPVDAPEMPLRNEGTKTAASCFRAPFVTGPRSLRVQEGHDTVTKLH